MYKLRIKYLTLATESDPVIYFRRPLIIQLELDSPG